MNFRPILIIPGETKSIFFEIFFKSLKKKFLSPLILVGSYKLLTLQMKSLKFKKKIKKLKLNNLSYEKLNNEMINIIDIKYNFTKDNMFLNISGSMHEDLRVDSNQKYELTDSRYDEKNKVNYIDMEVYLDTGEMIVTWRVLKHKERYFVIDLIISGISLYETKRSEFNSMLKNVDNDLAKLNEELYKKNESSYQKIIN